MSKTPRTDKFLKNTRSLPSAEWGEKAREFMCQLETELADKDRQLAEARAEIERLEKGIKTVQSAFKNHKNADAAIARIKLREAKILKASCNLDAVNSERAANEILTEELEKARAEIENLQWRVSDEQAKTKALLELNDKALELVNEARADAEHWRAECNSLQRMAHEARAEIKLKNEELDMFLAEQQAMNEIVERKSALIERMREALKSAEVVIDFYEANNEGAGRGIGKMVKAALAAERTEK